jgi:hypothetical protein
MKTYEKFNCASNGIKSVLNYLQKFAVIFDLYVSFLEFVFFQKVEVFYINELPKKKNRND